MRLRSRTLVACAAALLALSACSSDGDTTVAFCEEVAELLETDALNFEASAVDDPAVRSGLARTAQQFADVARAAPDEIRGDVDVLAGLTSALAEAVTDTDPRDPFARSTAILAAQQQFEERLPAAVEAYNAVVARHCVPRPGR